MNIFYDILRLESANPLLQFHSKTAKLSQKRNKELFKTHVEREVMETWGGLETEHLIYWTEDNEINVQSRIHALLIDGVREIIAEHCRLQLNEILLTEGDKRSSLHTKRNTHEMRLRLNLESIQVDFAGELEYFYNAIVKECEKSGMLHTRLDKLIFMYSSIMVPSVQFNRDIDLGYVIKIGVQSYAEKFLEPSVPTL